MNNIGLKYVVAAFAALAAIMPAMPACAQVVGPMPVIVTANTDPHNSWYQAQQLLKEATIADNSYNTFVTALNAVKHGNLGALVNMAGAMEQMQVTINEAMHNGKDPRLAAELQRNQFINQDLQALGTLQMITNNPSASPAQLMQATNFLLMQLTTQSARNQQVNYAAAQATLQRQQNLTNVANANASSTLQP